MTDNRTLDVTFVSSADQIIDMIGNYERIYNRRPEKLLFESKVRLYQICEDLLFHWLRAPFKRPLRFDGIEIVFADVIERQRKYYESLEPIEFWVEYWSRKDDFYFDPFEECNV